MPDQIARRLLAPLSPATLRPPFHNPVKKPRHPMASQNLGAQQWFFIALCGSAAPIEKPLNQRLM
jgi:hypothetical protein